MRPLLRVALAAAALVPLGGCGISLFSRHESAPAGDDERIVELERRMNAVERSLDVR